MAAATLHRKPGLTTVMNALEQFRKGLMSGVLIMAPHRFLKAEKQLVTWAMRRKGKNWQDDLQSFRFEFWRSADGETHRLCTHMYVWVPRIIEASCSAKATIPLLPDGLALGRTSLNRSIASEYAIRLLHANADLNSMATLAVPRSRRNWISLMVLCRSRVWSSVVAFPAITVCHWTQLRYQA